MFWKIKSIYINCAHKWKPSNKCSSLAFCSQNYPTPNQNRIFELSLHVWHTKVATIIPLLILPLFCCYQDCFPYHWPFSLLLLKCGHGMSSDFNWYCADKGKTSTDKALSLELNLRTLLNYITRSTGHIYLSFTMQFLNCYTYIFHIPFTMHSELICSSIYDIIILHFKLQCKTNFAFPIIILIRTGKIASFLSGKPCNFISNEYNT